MRSSDMVPGTFLFRLIKAYREFEGRFLILFVLLLATVLALPYVSDIRRVLTVAFVAIPLGGIYASAYSKRSLVIAVIVGIPAILTSMAHNLGVHIVSDVLAGASAVLFYGFTAVTVLNFILRQRTITADTIYGALSVYMLLAFTWAFGYMTIEAATTGSFYVNPEFHPGGVMRIVDSVYFSFVTLTTLGYGDILPVTPQARIIAAMEAVCGVLFTATLIASLVGRLAVRKSEQ